MPPSLCASTSADDRKPCSARSAAMRPESAPRDWWNLMVGVPQCAKVPADWLPARPKALRWRSASRPSSFPAAAAPPNGPMTPGECQPFARNAGYLMPSPTRTVVSRPAATARISARPLAPLRSAIAKAGGTTWGVVWHSVGRWTSQTVTAVIRYPFCSVAPASESGSPPMTLASRELPRAPASARICLLSSPWRPAIALASVSRMMSLTRSRIGSGSCRYSRPATKRASSAVGVSVELGTRVLHRLGPFHDFRSYERGEFLGRRDRRLRRQADQPFAHVGLLVDLRHGAVDLLEDRRRDRRRADQPIPADRDVARQCRLVERRHVGQSGDALGAGYGDRPRLLVLDERHRGGRGGEGQRDLTAD